MVWCPLAKTRDTNNHIENWFRIIKHIIFKGDHMRPKEFISTFYSKVNGRIKEQKLALSQEIARNTFKISKN